MKRIILLLIVPVLAFSQNTQGTKFASTFRDSASLVMPSGTGAYADKDVISNSATAGASGFLKFENVARQPGGKGLILWGLCSTDTALTAGSIDLLLFSDTLYTSDTVGIPRIADNAPNRLSDTLMYKYIGKMSFAFTSTNVGTGSTGNYAEWTGLQAFMTRNKSNAIYGRVVATSAITFKNGGRLRFKIFGTQD